MKYFTGIETLEELKKEYHRLAIRHHPDLGGDLETMQAINNEFDSLFQLLKNQHKDKDGKKYESDRSTKETPEEFRGIINDLFNLHMQEVVIEIIGSFMWLTGKTKPYKDDIAKLGFIYSGVKKAWYKKPDWYKRRNKKQYDLDKIRGMYGSQTVKQEEQKERLSIKA